MSLDERLEKVASRRARARLQAAFELAGAVGLEALAPTRPIEPWLMLHALAATRTWLKLAPPPVATSDFTVSRKENRLTVAVAGQVCFQLRFVPDHCAWMLLSRRHGSWWPAAFGNGGLATQWKNLRRLWPRHSPGRK
ncbi:MAG: hypothetical protein AB7S38_36680 [Vulcanimicrobiota bacterium]